MPPQFPVGQSLTHSRRARPLYFCSHMWQTGDGTMASARDAQRIGHPPVGRAGSRNLASRGRFNGRGRNAARQVRQRIVCTIRVHHSEHAIPLPLRQTALDGHARPKFSCNSFFCRPDEPTRGGIPDMRTLTLAATLVASTVLAAPAFAQSFKWARGQDATTLDPHAQNSGQNFSS